jgi:hypothetical protein
VNNSTRYQSVSEILDNIRAQLTDRAHDDIHLLVKIFNDLKNIDAYRLSPYDASHWLIQKPTERAIRSEQFVRQVGFNSGFGIGFLVGFAVCAFLALTMKYG